MTALPRHRPMMFGSLGLLALAGLVACDEKSEQRALTCRNGMAAFAAATDFARGRLAMPPMAQDTERSVNIAGGRTEYLGDCRHKITSHVERRNPDGAIRDDRFEAVVRFGGREWELEAVTFY